MSSFVPLLRAPESWPTWLVGVGAMIVLAGLDLVGSVAAKEWAATSQIAPLVVGIVAFVALFWVYASALQYAELALVTMGWIVILQVTLLLLDRFHYGSQLAPGKWVAVVVILAAQAYLLAGQDGPGDTRSEAEVVAPTVSAGSTLGQP